MLYQIAHAESPSRLTEAVNKAIESGWEPIGGVEIAEQSYVLVNGTSTWYYQALIKR